MILKINDRIRNRRVNFFNRFELDMRYDAIASTFAFDFFFDPKNKEHIELACIGHYHIATIENNDELLLSGFILSEQFIDSPEKKLSKFTGYSFPGVLEDCQIPPSLYPLQSDGLTLKQIVDKLIAPFRIKYVIDSAVNARMNQVFEKTTASESQSIKSYLSELASQKNIVISHNEKGELVFTEAKTKSKPIINFDGGVPFDSMTLTFNGQPMHSEITVIREANKKGGNAGQSTIKNPYVPFVYRPKTVVQSSGDDVDTSLAARTALSEELKNLKLIITVDRWDIEGKIIKPNNIITVKNENLYLFNSSKWFIESVKLTGDNEKTTATLTCVIPEVYNQDTPKYIFEGINLHG